MKRYRTVIDEDEIIDADGVVRRNGAIRVKVVDSEQSALAEAVTAAAKQATQIVNADGFPAGHKSGYLFPRAGSDAHRQMEVNDALGATRRATLADASKDPKALPSTRMTRDQYIADLSNAWRAP